MGKTCRGFTVPSSVKTGSVMALLYLRIKRNRFNRNSFNLIKTLLTNLSFEALAL